MFYFLPYFLLDLKILDVFLRAGCCLTNSLSDTLLKGGNIGPLQVEIGHHSQFYQLRRIKIISVESQS